MMLSRGESKKRTGGNLGGGNLLNDIEAISKALYSDNTDQRGSYSSTSSRYRPIRKAPLPESKSKSKSKEANKDLMEKEKKSIWSWKGLKAFSLIRNQRFNCCFSLQVHCVKGLPPFFDDLSLLVHWKRRDEELVTRPVTVIDGVAEFEDHLTLSCSVYGSRNGPHHSAKYEAKHFLLYASVFGTPELDLGKHRMDLTRILPLTLEELEEEKSSGKWTTSIKLSGKAKGAVMNVSFTYVVLGNSPSSLRSDKDVPNARHLRQSSGSALKFQRPFSQNYDGDGIMRVGSLPARLSSSSQSVEDIKDLHEVLPPSRSELSESVNILYQKLEEDKSGVSVNIKPEFGIHFEHIEPRKSISLALTNVAKADAEDGCGISDFSVIEQGVEPSLEEQVKLEEDTVETAQCFEAVTLGTGFDQERAMVDSQGHPFVEDLGKNHHDESDCKSNTDDTHAKELLMKDLESALNNVSNLEKEGIDMQELEQLNEVDHLGIKSNYRGIRKGRSLSLDDVALDDITDSVASEFLDMLGIEHSPFGLGSESEPESPRERLLRQFEKDAFADGCSLFNFDMDTIEEEFDYDAPAEFCWSSISSEGNHSFLLGALNEIPKTDTEPTRSRTMASELEGLETEALMREWGLNEKAFQLSPPSSRSGFGSPIDLPPEDPYELPPLGEGLGPFIQTRNGGFLRSMNPSLYRNAKNGGNLIMQVSTPVVVPAEMGSGIMDILQHLASIGIEKLSAQANKLMPLEDITGMTIQQMTWEGSPSEGPKRQDLLLHAHELEQTCEGKRVNGRSSKPRSSKFESSSAQGTDTEYVSLEDLAPSAMEKIEALSVEGLRIQSDMSDEVAPSNITPQSIGEFSALEGKRVSVDGSIGLEGTGGLKLLDIKDNGDDIDGLMSLSLTLDEWMKLDAGEFDDEDNISEQTSRILSAHHANSVELKRVRSQGEKRRGKGKKGGLLGNNFTVALMVQLRDPIRNYEPVGTPMLALIQVERVFVPPKPKIYSTMPEVKNSYEEEDESEPTKKAEVNEELKEEKIPEEELISQYKITEVHVAGVKTEPSKKKLWGSSAQQQSGSRWLLANGMGKKNKHPFMKSKTVTNGKSHSADSRPATTTTQPGDTLWSISSRVHGTGTKWKELAALNPHIRNPNIVLPNQSIRLR